MKRRLVIIPVVAMLAVMSAAFVSRSDAAPTARGAQGVIPLLRVGLLTNNFPRGTLDASRNGDYGILGIGLEPLLTLNSQGQIRPWLAESVTQPGPGVIIAHLRHGVKFWDGTEMTSADVANALNYWRYPASNVAFYFTSIKDIKATDRYTVVVTLKHSDVTALYQLTLAAGIFERKQQLADKEHFGDSNHLPVGTGPWKFDSYDPTVGAELSANPHWWGGKVPIQHVSFKFLSDETSAALAMRAHQIDLFPNVGGPRAFAATSHAKVVKVAAPNVGFLAMPTKAGPWRDLHVRRAVAYALKPRDLMAVLTSAGLGARPVSTLIPPSMLRLLAPQAKIDALVRSLPSYAFNLGKARQEMAKSAYPNGFSVTVPFPGFSPTDSGCYQVLAVQLQKIGIKLTPKLEDVGTWFADEFGAPDTRYPQLWCGFGAAPYPDPSVVAGWFFSLRTSANYSSSFNYADYSPPAIQSLVKAGVTTGNKAKRFEIYAQILRRAAADVPYVPLFTADATYAIANNFAWPGFPSAYGGLGGGPYLLGIKPV